MRSWNRRSLAFGVAIAVFAASISVVMVARHDRASRAQVHTTQAAPDTRKDSVTIPENFVPYSDPSNGLSIRYPALWPAPVIERIAGIRGSQLIVHFYIDAPHTVIASKTTFTVTLSTTDYASLTDRGVADRNFTKDRVKADLLGLRHGEDTPYISDTTFVHYIGSLVNQRSAISGETIVPLDKISVTAAEFSYSHISDCKQSAVGQTTGKSCFSTQDVQTIAAIMASVTAI